MRVFVDSDGKIKPFGYCGFTAYAKRLENKAVNSFWQAIGTTKLHSLE
jgi:hypothetical protein